MTKITVKEKTQEVLINKGISIPQETQGRPETVKH